MIWRDNGIPAALQWWLEAAYTWNSSPLTWKPVELQIWKDICKGGGGRGVHYYLFHGKKCRCIYRIWKNYAFVSVNIPWMINKFKPNAYKCVGIYNNIRISLHGLPLVNAIYIYMFMYILLWISYLMNKCNLPAWMFSCFPRGPKNKRTHTILKILCVGIRGIFETS